MTNFLHKDNNEKSNDFLTSFIIWFAVSLVMSITIVSMTRSSLGFFRAFFFILLSIILGPLAAVIGNSIRKFSQPDTILVGPGIGVFILAKIFWKIGPQLIGVCIVLLVLQSTIYSSSNSQVTTPPQSTGNAITPNIPITAVTK